VGDPLRNDLLWQIQAAHIVDIDKIRTWRYSLEDTAIEQIADLVSTGKKPIWVVDSKAALKKVPDISKAIGEDVGGRLVEESAYASEAQQDQEAGEMMDMAEKWKRTRFRVEPIVSPRSGKPGYKITW
jgi:hypothetical protein